MSKRLRRWSHKFVSASGYQRMAGDLEVQGNLIGPSMALVSRSIEQLACATTTPVKLATPSAEGSFRTIVVRWTKQYNLSNFDHYEVQVSDDNVTWYSLKFDGTDWKNVLNDVTPCYVEMMVHSQIPHAGAAEAPTGQLLYYRVRQATITPVYSAYSDAVNATTSTVETGDLAASSVYANNIIAAEIATLLLRATSAVIVGQDYEGTPPAGAQRVVCDDNELRLDEWDGSAWIVIYRVGGDDILKWYLQARGLIKTGADISGLQIGDKAPAAACQVFDFEDDYKDKAEVDPWDIKSNLEFTANFKFGAKALTHQTGLVGYLRDDSALAITNTDFGLGGWHYKSIVTTDRLLLAVVKGGFTWTSRTSASARVWWSVCWSPELGLFCAVAASGAADGQVMTSPDGFTWTSRTSASAQSWYSVCWSPERGLFCAVAMTGAVGVQVMTSPDGITWTSRTSASAQLWNSVCWSPELGLFCAVAANGAVGVQVMTSPDGFTWTSRTSASVQQWRSVCWSPELGLFCAVAIDGAVGVQVMTSPDGITWTSRTSASAQQWYSVCWSPGLRLFCAVANNGVVGVQVMTSPDGFTWTSRTSASAQAWISVCWSPERGLFCAINTGGTIDVQVMTSPLSGMRIYETSTGYKLIVGTAVEQTRVAADSQYHHVGITERNDGGQQKWGMTVDSWSTEVNIAAHPIEAGSWLFFYLRDGARIDDWAVLAGSALLSLTEMKSHFQSGQPWVDFATGMDYALDLLLMAKAGGQVVLYPNTSVIPIGFIYIQFYNEALPATLWGGTWLNVSNQWPGYFFRAEGGNAAAWGTAQADAFQGHKHSGVPPWVSPSFLLDYSGSGPGRSTSGNTGNPVTDGVNGTPRTDIETRPIDYAMRIWRRTA